MRKALNLRPLLTVSTESKCEGKAMKSIASNLVTTLAVFAVSSGASAAQLTLDQYLEQVQKGNDGYKSSEVMGSAAADKTADTEMVYAPTLFATIQSAVDKKELIPASQRGNQTDHTSLQVGVSKLTSFGTAAKLSYSTSHTRIKGTSPMYVPDPEWTEAAPTLEVSHPLWKNANGKDVSRSIELQQGQAQITQLTEQLKRKFTLTEAEGNYWRLVLARENVRVCRENLDRAKKIVDWNRRRVSNELADAADLIQAQALEEIRQIELTMALDEERVSSHAFNTARGQQSESVKDELVKITPELITKIPIPQRTGDREDLKAILQSERLSLLGAELAVSKYDPSLDLFASGTMNGRQDSYGKAYSESMKGKHNTYAVGLKVSAPLGGESVSRIRAGYAKERESAALAASRKRFENEREWSDLINKLTESKARLMLTQKIEVTQKRKLDAERERQSRGRSTMFQVMQAETDYASSQLNVIRNKAEILGIIARMKTFGGEG